MLDKSIKDILAYASGEVHIQTNKEKRLRHHTLINNNNKKKVHSKREGKAGGKEEEVHGND